MISMFTAITIYLPMQSRMSRQHAQRCGCGCYLVLPRAVRDQHAQRAAALHAKLRRPPGTPSLKDYVKKNTGFFAIEGNDVVLKK